MKIKLLTLSISSVLASSAFGQGIVLDYQREAEINKIIDEEMGEVYRKGIAEESGEGPLSSNETRLLNMKIKAIEKRIYEQDKLRPYIEDLYQSNAEDAFDEHVRERLGFSPDQWRELRRRQEEVDRAKNEPMNDVDVRIREETLDNGSVKPINIDVVRGYATAIVFVDAAGNPWPIQGDVTGDGDSYNTRVTLDHVAVIDNIREFRESNTLVNLVGVDIPIVFRLRSNRQTSDSRIIIHLPELGPNSDGEVKVRNNAPGMGNELRELLNTGKVRGYREFGFNEIPGSVFFSDGWMYIRTKNHLVLPQAIEESFSPTGYNVYKLPANNNFLFRDGSGNRIKATLSGERNFRVRYNSRLFEK